GGAPAPPHATPRGSPPAPPGRGRAPAVTPSSVASWALVQVVPANRRRLERGRVGGAPGTGRPRPFRAAALVAPGSVTETAAMLVRPSHEQVLASGAHRTRGRVDRSRISPARVVPRESTAG